MAFEMVTKVGKTTYPNGYWKIAEDIYDNGRYLRVVFHFYPDKATRDADINSFHKTHAKPYYITDEEDDKAYSDAKAADNLKAWLYEKIPTILEGEPPIRDEDGFILIDPKNPLLIDGKKTKIDQRKSYFETAVEA